LFIDIPGPAAIEIDDRDKLAFVSSDDRSWKQSSRFFHRPSSKTEQNGGIYTLPLSVSSNQELEEMQNGQA
jgi:hypothetical protein